MKKLAAFAAAFLLALTAALVPLAVSDLGRPGAQPSRDVKPPAITVSEYRYDVRQPAAPA